MKLFKKESKQVIEYTNDSKLLNIITDIYIYAKYVSFPLQFSVRVYQVLWLCFFLS